MTQQTEIEAKQELFSVTCFPAQYSNTKLVVITCKSFRLKSLSYIKHSSKYYLPQTFGLVQKSATKVKSAFNGLCILVGN